MTLEKGPTHDSKFNPFSDDLYFSPIHFMDGGLIGRFDEEFVDVHMRRAAGHPDENFGDIPGCQGNDALVRFPGQFDIALEPHQREFRFREAGIDGGNTQASSVQFQPKGAGDLQLARFGRAISRPAFISRVACNRATY